MEIDSHILGLSMEFEKQNIIITEWETDRARNRSEVIYQRRKKKRSRKRQPKIYLEPTDSEPNYDEEDGETNNDDNESGFEDNSPTEEDSAVNNDDEDSDEAGAVPRILYDNSAESDQGKQRKL